MIAGGRRKEEEGDWDGGRREDRVAKSGRYNFTCLQLLLSKIMSLLISTSSTYKTLGLCNSRAISKKVSMSVSVSTQQVSSDTVEIPVITACFGWFRNGLLWMGRKGVWI